MSMRVTITSVVLQVLFLGPYCTAGHPKEPYVGSKAFERIKQLAGQWEGTMDMGEGPMSITATYEVTAGGSAVLEKVFEGSPMEMVTVYHDNSEKQCMLVHYCLLHNQPKMILKDMDENSIRFVLSDKADIDVSNEEHMHSAWFKFEGPDKMTQYWSRYENGQEQPIAGVTYHRKP